MKVKKSYIRDGRAPIPKKEVTSRIMSKIRAKNTKPEILLRKALTKEGIKGFKLHYKRIPGRPDICYPPKKLAIFVNGCFWHRCPICKPKAPKSNIMFWKDKFKKNVERDKRKIEELLDMGWAVFVAWECEIINDTDQVVERIKIMMSYDRTDPRSIEGYAKQLVGHTLNEAISEKIIKTMNKEDKGAFGRILETCYFGINPGNSQEPDFKEAGVELKATPLKQINKGLVSKERLVMNLIDYVKLEKETWETSSFLKKNALLLLVLYLWKKDSRSVLDYSVKQVGLWEYPEEDLKIIKDDWLKIQQKVKEGRAHELSEGDTYYLGACRKGHKEGPRKQPKSDIGAKQRAFSLKQSYVNVMIQALFKRKASEVPERIIKDINEYSGDKTFESIVIDKFKPYYGMTEKAIINSLGISPSKKAKNYNNLISLGILGVKKKRIEEFEKADITMKSIVLENNDNLIESISFPTFKYTELIKDYDWETSSTRDQFEKRFLFVVYKKSDKGEKILSKAMFWTLPYAGLQEVKKVWQETKIRIKNNRYDGLPGMSWNKVCHVRPHARNKKDVFPTPDGKTAVKKCFWLNAKYIQDQIMKNGSTVG